MKDLLVSVNITDFDSDSSKPSSKTTSCQSSPLILKGHVFHNIHTIIISKPVYISSETLILVIEDD